MGERPGRTFPLSSVGREAPRSESEPQRQYEGIQLRWITSAGMTL